MVDIAMKHAGVQRVRQQLARRLRRPRQHAAMSPRGRFQLAEPDGERREHRRRLGRAGGVKPGGGAEDAHRLIILAGLGHRRQRAFSRGALEQQGGTVPSQHPGGAIPGPPVHQGRALALLLIERHLEHGRLQTAPHRRQP